MTRADELKKEAEDYAEQCYGWTNNDQVTDVAIATYITSAEPREKRIEELENIIANLKEQVQSQVEATIELDKENAELKVLLDCKNCSELSEEECEVCAEASHFKCKGKDQLTKAIKLLKETQGYLENEDDELYDEIEQFLRR